MLEGLKRWARITKRDVVALWLAARDPRVSWYAKAMAGAVAAYALSPIDLIPDFIPVLGYLDDLLIVPVGVFLTVQMIQPVVMADLRAKADLRAQRPISASGAAAIAAIWVAALVAALAWWRTR
ncbi:MAG: DUF1232 domain-containing protein [Acidobacteriota bacterium]